MSSTGRPRATQMYKVLPVAVVRCRPSRSVQSDYADVSSESPHSRRKLEALATVTLKVWHVPVLVQNRA